jgi:hypothetical protein
MQFSPVGQEEKKTKRYLFCLLGDIYRRVMIGAVYLSGQNPELLTWQHATSAHLLKKKKIKKN